MCSKYEKDGVSVAQRILICRQERIEDVPVTLFRKMKRWASSVKAKAVMTHWARIKVACTGDGTTSHTKHLTLLSGLLLPCLVTGHLGIPMYVGPVGDVYEKTSDQ